MEKWAHKDRAIAGYDRTIGGVLEPYPEVGRRVGEGQRIVGHSSKLRPQNQSRAGASRAGKNARRGSRGRIGCKYSTGKSVRIGEGI